MRARWLAQAALATILGALGPPALAEDAALGAAQAAFLKRVGLDQRIQDIGWKLATGNAAYCERAVPSVGLQLHDMASYGDPDGVRKLLGLERDFAVLTAAAGSPAAEAGLATNRAIATIAGVDPSAWPAEARRDWQRTQRALDWIDRQLAESGALALGLADGTEATLTPVPACASRFELGGDSKRAMAEGARVIIGREFPGLNYAEDELAAAVAHELAHNLLQHRALLDSRGRKQSTVRLTEREADRLMPWLLANAGYDPDAASRFMQRWGPRHSGGLFRKRSHDGWDERAEFIAAEVELVKATLAETGAADWRALFRREVEPAR